MATPKSLSIVSSARFLAKLRATRVKHRLSISDVSGILCCSPRTAQNLLRPTTSVAIRRSYSNNLARYLKLAEPPWEREPRRKVGLKAVLRAWKDAVHLQTRRRVAWRLVALLSEYAHNSYGLSAVSSISIPYTGEPLQVVTNVAAARTRATGKFTINFDPRDRGSLEMIYTDLLGRDTYRGPLIPGVVARLFKQIRSWQKAPH